MNKHNNKKLRAKRNLLIKRLVLVCFAVTAAILIGFGAVKIIKDSGNTSSSSDDRDSSPVSAPVIKDFVGLKNVKASADVTKYFTYGTSFNLTGSFRPTDSTTVTALYLSLINAYTNPDGSTANDGFETKLDFKVNDTDISFTFNSINTGFPLEHIKDGEYCMVLKAIMEDGSVEYYTFSNKASENDICYYTLTKNSLNQKIDISFSEYNGQSYIKLNAAQSPLPDDVYDIVIDPGHGGTDSGAVNGTYYESDIVLDYGLDLKKALEAAGFKVKLTRDGTEDKNTMMAYTMYDDDGRVNVACASNAKYCLSLHLNSNAEQLSSGGIQIYTSFRADTAFAATLADNIVSLSGTYLSKMMAFKVSDGVYRRSFSESDVADSKSEAASKAYTPYNVTTDTDYYYMIRELGGIATNAYVDGRSTTYGTNHYCDSIQGVESYILELGFISINSDLEHILNNKDGYIKGIVTSFEALTK